MVEDIETQEEQQNVKKFFKTIKEYNNQVKKLKELNKPFCEKCVKQDWDNNVYEASRAEQYFMLTEVKRAEIRNKTRLGTIVISPYVDYECKRGHGLSVFSKEYTEAAIVVAPREEVKVDGKKE